VKFTFKDDKQDEWTTAFLHELSQWDCIPESILTKDEFLNSVDTLQGAALAASHSTCL